MSDPFTNLREKTGRTMDEWFAVLKETGLEKHAELMSLLKGQHGVSHGFANGIALQFRTRSDSPTHEDLVDVQYAEGRAVLRPIYERLVAAASAFGSDVEIVPKKSGVSLRRSKQFALIEAPSAKRVQLGLQLKGEPVTVRLLAGNEMCSHRVNLGTVDDVDDEVLTWMRDAYERG